MACKANVILPGQSLAKALFLVIAGFLTVSATIASEAKVSTPAAIRASGSPCSTEGYRDFDFWLGDWQVRLADGTLAGKNRVQASADGCFITERWQGAGGSTGFSVNFYEPVSHRWRQIWVSAASVIEISGGLQDSSMVLVGEIRYRQTPPDASGTANGGGLVRSFRGKWTPLPDGRVRQFFEELIPDNISEPTSEEKWQPWFEGFYAKAVE